MFVKCFFEVDTKDYHFCGGQSLATGYTVLKGLYCLRVKYARQTFFEANTKEYHFCGGPNATIRFSSLYFVLGKYMLDKTFFWGNTIEYNFCGSQSATARSSGF
jgi:hypothetical protein